MTVLYPSPVLHLFELSFLLMFIFFFLSSGVLSFLFRSHSLSISFPFTFLPSHSPFSLYFSAFSSSSVSLLVYPFLESFLLLFLILCILISSLYYVSSSTHPCIKFFLFFFVFSLSPPFHFICFLHSFILCISSPYIPLVSQFSTISCIPFYYLTLFPFISLIHYCAFSKLHLPLVHLSFPPIFTLLFLFVAFLYPFSALMFNFLLFLCPLLC